MKKILILIPFCSITLSMFGCATAPNLRSHSDLQSSNPMHKIAIIGSARVEWPRMGSKTPVLGLQSSKAGIENIIPLTRNTLENKGYEVTFAEPVAVGFPVPGRENVVYRDYEEEGSDEKWVQTDDSPAHEYPVLESDPDAKQAAIKILQDMEKTIHKRQIWLFDPDVEAVKTLAKGTNSDTVCVLRTFGLRYTNARATGAFFLGMLSGSYQDTSDRGDTVFACIAGEDGSVLWQKIYQIREDPMDIKQDDVEAGLKFFPAANMPLTGKCKVLPESQGTSMFYCED